MRVLGASMLVVAGFLAVVAFVYAGTSGEEAGSVMLLLAAGLALVIGGYLLTLPPGDGDDRAAVAGEAAATERPLAPAAAAGAPSTPAATGPYLPASSVWPFWMGLGAVVLANGVALGLWGLIPGGILTAIGVLGFARQSRRRD